MLDSFGCFVGDEGYWPKRKIRKVERESAVPGVSLLNLSHSRFFIFRYTRGLIPNPPNRHDYKMVQLCVVSCRGLDEVR
jgi:hypothetical protein